MKTLKVLKSIGLGILWLGGIALILFITMNLWNWLIPALFHGPIVTFWQTAGLIVLSKIFLSGFGPRGGGGRRQGKGFGDFHEGERPSREDWWKRFNEKNRSRGQSSTPE
jgi:hypothetical protein